MIFEVIGSVEPRGFFEGRDTLVDFAKAHGFAVKPLGGRILGAQVGGALGRFVWGSDMALPLADFMDELASPHIYWITEPYCPVDHLRFMARFVLREVGVDTDGVRGALDWIEAVAQGHGAPGAQGSHGPLGAGMQWGPRSYSLGSGLGSGLVSGSGGGLGAAARYYATVLLEGETPAEKRLGQHIAGLVKGFAGVFDDHYYEGRCEAGICRTLMDAQCINACPAGVNIPGYVALMKQNRMGDGYALMRKTNPLSLVCGKVCARPCESRCRRGEIEGTVGVRALQRYVSQVALQRGDTLIKEDKLAPNGRRISIVGAGPAGLTAAYFLQRSGYAVRVYEGEGEPGGMLAYGIPQYRLPLEDLLSEVETIVNLGVTMHYNTRVGKDIALGDLIENSDAVIVASGADLGNSVPAWETPKTQTAVSFLRQVRKGALTALGGKVVVVGGGDVAMDACRTALRLGASEVTCVSLESYHGMPASLEERQLAAQEGVKLLCGYGLSGVCEKGTPSLPLKLTLERCLSVLDLDGKFSPVMDQGDGLALEADHLILAIGQRANEDLSGTDLMRARGFVVADPKTGRTNMAKVYAVGDVVKPGAAIGAIAMAKQVCIAIDRNLGGNGIYTGEAIAIPGGRLSETTWDDRQRHEPLSPVIDPHHPFAEVTETFSHEDALYEAQRCMRCDLNSKQPLMVRPRHTMRKV